jgi:hypothetical protein
MTPFKEGQEERIRERVSQMLDREPIPVSGESKSHIVNIGTSILCTKWGIGYPGGGFVQAVVDNDLMGAFSRADSIHKDAIGFYCKLLYNILYID